MAEPSVVLLHVRVCVAVAVLGCAIRVSMLRTMLTILPLGVTSLQDTASRHQQPKARFETPKQQHACWLRKAHPVADVNAMKQPSYHLRHHQQPSMTKAIGDLHA